MGGSKNFMENHSIMSKQAQRAEEMALGTYITNEGIITASILHKYSTGIKITIIGYKSNIVMGQGYMFTVTQLNSK